MSVFENLERLNAQIDVWIDEENYLYVLEALCIADDSLKKDVDSCFDKICTNDRDSQWQTILSRDISSPIKEACYEGNKIALDAGWSELFYAKLLRARIQDKGTDCYLRRLDEVEEYLECRLPKIENENTSKLTILYLLELAAASQSFEILGFAERAKRVMNERKKMFNEDRENFVWFYDLFIRYNTGVGHFHKLRYRKAILEFNHIIAEVRKEEASNGPKLGFFKRRQGYLLLYFPAVIFRADVQLRLQLAYHALDTINTYLAPAAEISTYKETRRHLIATEAYQQMGRLGATESWRHLSKAYGLLWKLQSENGPEKKASQQELEELAERTSFKPLSSALFFNGQLNNIKGQFLHFYVEDHLEWLEKVSESMESQVRCSRLVSNLFAARYFNLAKFNAGDRNGYYMQLAKLVEWLVRTDAPELRTVAKELHERILEMLKKPSGNECDFCEAPGVELNKMTHEYYSWYKDYIIKYFEHLLRLHHGDNTDKDRIQHEFEEFIILFIEREGKREDLRIADLILRYKMSSVQKNLTMSQELCRPNDIKINLSAFDLLLDGKISHSESEQRDLISLNSEEYKLIMEKWDKEFIRRLRSSSNQSGHKRGLYLIGLKRWNSSSPAQGRSMGGGYLLYHADEYGTVDLGIAIDPGFDFVRNLFHEGFSISDIDIVLISHSHVDHIRDFESIVQLLTDLKKGDNSEKCVHVVLSLGVYERLKHIIEDPFYRYHVEPYIIDARREIEPGYFENLSACDITFCSRNAVVGHKQEMRYWADLPDKPDTSSVTSATCPKIKVTIQPTRAYHTDPSRYSDSFGFKIKVAELIESAGSTNTSAPCVTTLGYTGDTKWVFPVVSDPLAGKDNRHPITDVSGQYVDCDVVIIHLGSVVDRDPGGGRKELMNCQACNLKQQEVCRDIVCRNDHPYMVGLIRMLSSLNSARHEKIKKEGISPQLIIISEFGEELRGGIRVNLIERLKRAYSGALSFLMLDVGIDIQLMHLEQENNKSIAKSEPKALCIQCDRFVSIDDARYERYGVDEALFCVCRTCMKATPLNVIQDLMRQLYDVGHELRTLYE
jgi:ribonuclease BN (tRNA processing enzyme)